MKKILSGLFFILITGLIGAQDFAARFATMYKGNYFNTIHISKRMFALATASVDSIKEPELAAIMKDLTGLKVLRFEGNASGSVYDNACKQVTSNAVYEELMVIEGDLERVRIYIREEKDLVKELVLFIIDGKMFTLINIEGRLNLDQVTSLASSINIDGIEYMNKIPSPKTKSDK